MSAGICGKRVGFEDIFGSTSSQAPSTKRSRCSPFGSSTRCSDFGFGSEDKLSILLWMFPSIDPKGNAHFGHVSHSVAYGESIINRFSERSYFKMVVSKIREQMVVAAGDTAQPAGQAYWKKVLPNTPMPRAIKNLLTGAGDNVRKDSVTIDAQHKGSINIPDVFKVHGAQRKGSMNIDDVYKVYGTQSGTKMHKHVGYPRYVLDMLFFVGNDLQTGTRMTLHFTDPSSCDTPFISRSEANSLPFTSSKLPEILDHFSIQPNSNQAESMRSTLTACEQPAMEGEKKHCATSLESMIDFSTTTLGSHDVITLSTSADRENSPKQQYEIISFRARKMSGCNSVFCHTLSYAYAVFYCHTTEEAKTYHVSLVGKDGTRVEAVAICHTETSNWDPTDLPFRVLGVKPGMVPICHFLPQGHVVWTPRIK